jgi:multidrug resistance efflux pump
MQGDPSETSPAFLEQQACIMSVITLENTDQDIAVEELSASRVDWKRLRRIALHCGLVAVGIGGTAFYLSDGFAGFLLNAEGRVARERVAVASAFEGRVTEIFVQPGDHVGQGQKIAVVKSVAISKTLADLEAERARLRSKIALLEARRQVILATLPLAKTNAERTATFLQDLDHASATGLAVRKSLQEMTSASLTAAEHAAGLEAEQGSLSVELAADRAAYGRVISAYNELYATYNNGELYAPVSGDIGATVAHVGEAISTANSAVANIFTGKSFALAYLPGSYLFEGSAGRSVAIKTRNEVVNGRIERVLPLTEKLPSDLAPTSRALEHGRLVRIALPASHALPIDQRVHVTTCLLSDCDAGLMQTALRKTRSAIGSVYQAAMSIGTETKGLLERLASGQRANRTL